MFQYIQVYMKPGTITGYYIILVVFFVGRMSVEPKLVNNVVSQRTKEYAVRQQEMQMETK